MNGKRRESAFLRLSGPGLSLLLAAPHLEWLPQGVAFFLGYWMLFCGFCLLAVLRRVPWYWVGLLGGSLAGGVLGVREALAGSIDVPSGIFAGLVVLACAAWQWPRRAA